MSPPNQHNTGQRRRAGAIVAVVAGASAAGIAHHARSSPDSTGWGVAFDAGLAVLIVLAVVLLVFILVKKRT